jgi:hypothetical protein
MRAGMVMFIKKHERGSVIVIVRRNEKISYHLLDVFDIGSIAAFLPCGQKALFKQAKAVIGCLQDIGSIAAFLPCGQKALFKQAKAVIGCLQVDDRPASVVICLLQVARLKEMMVCKKKARYCDCEAFDAAHCQSSTLSRDKQAHTRVVSSS